MLKRSYVCRLSTGLARAVHGQQALVHAAELDGTERHDRIRAVAVPGARCALRLRGKGLMRHKEQRDKAGGQGGASRWAEERVGQRAGRGGAGRAGQGRAGQCTHPCARLRVASACGRESTVTGWSEKRSDAWHVSA